MIGTYGAKLRSRAQFWHETLKAEKTSLRFSVPDKKFSVLASWAQDKIFCVILLAEVETLR